MHMFAYLYCFDWKSIYCRCQSLSHNNRLAVNITIIIKEMHCLPASPTRKLSISVYAIHDKIVVGAVVCTTYACTTIGRDPECRDRHVYDMRLFDRLVLNVEYVPMMCGLIYIACWRTCGRNCIVCNDIENVTSLDTHVSASMKPGYVLKST